MKVTRAYKKWVMENEVSINLALKVVNTFILVIGLIVGTAGVYNIHAQILDQLIVGGRPGVERATILSMGSPDNDFPICVEMAHRATKRWVHFEPNVPGENVVWEDGPCPTE